MRLQNIDNKKVECEEPCDGRLSSTVPREEWGETPRSYSTKEDFRTVSEDVRYALRRRAIRMIAGGKRKKDVAKAFGVKAGTISDWVKLHRQGGDAALRCKKKGAKNGMLKLLSTDQERQVQRMITDKMPDQLKLNFGLWTRKAVSELIFREFGIQVAISTMGKYLRAWGYTPQKPLKRAYE